MKNLLLATLLLLLFTNMQCNKSTTPPEPPTTQPNGLPLETQEGKNTFGCFWNDTLWLPIGGVGGPAIICSYNNDSNWLSMSMYNEKRSETLSFSFSLEDIGQYDFFNKYPNKIKLLRSGSNWSQYNSIEQNKFKLIITKFIKSYTEGNKRITGIVSGNFSGVFYKQNSSGIGVDLKDSINISKAVFDLKVY